MPKDSFTPGIVGWLAVIGTAVAFDVWAIKTKRPTLSRTLGHFLAHPVVGPILAGAEMGLTYHLLVEELLPAFFEERVKRPAFTLAAPPS